MSDLPPSNRTLSRRSFLIHSTAAAAAAALAPGLVSARASDARLGAGFEPVRIRGRVHENGRGIGRVAVSDGLSVVDTDPEGRFTLLSHTARPYVQLSLPSGYRIPRNPRGTARFYQRIVPDGNGEMAVEFPLERLPVPDERHRMLLLADPQTQTMEEIGFLMDQTVPDVQALLAREAEMETFGIGCGDIMFDDLDLFPQYERAVEAMGIPFFQVVGNHDITFHDHGNDRVADIFRDHFGPEHYSFNRGAVHYVVLNDVFWYGTDYIGYLTDEQLTWLEADLARVEPGARVVVAVHIPVMQTGHTRRGEARPSVRGTVQNRAALYRLLEPFRAHIVSGHTHQQEHVFEGGVHEHIHGTVCGAWWSGPICHDGTPNGYGVYEARGEELVWQYKSTGYPLDHQLRVYLPGALPERPGAVVANVWNWDPEWTVVLYEDGERRGPMEQDTLLDPLSVRIHSGDGEPSRRPWVNPHPTSHMFVADVSADPSRVLVEATDRFGRVHTARPASILEVEAWALRSWRTGVSTAA